MRHMDEIIAIAAERKGGIDALEGLLSRPLPREALLATTADRWLSAMAKAIFQAGFSWKVIEAKWPGFEEAFEGFEPGPLHFQGPEALDRLLADKRIVRNGQKITAVLANAALLLDLEREHGSVARFFADWPDEDYVGLLASLTKRGSRLGGTTGQRVPRMMGRDGFILSNDVTARLVAEGVIEGPAKSKSAMAKVQTAFNGWRDQSGRSLTEISRILAMSVG